MTYAQQQLIDRGRFQFTAPLLEVPLKTSTRAVKGALSSFTRATTATVEGAYKTIQHCKSGEARFPKCRRVENRVSSDLATWTRSGLEVVKIAGGFRLFDMIFGSGLTSATFTSYVSEIYYMSFEARLVDEDDAGKPILVGLTTDGGDTTTQEITPTTQWRRYAMAYYQMDYGGATYAGFWPTASTIASLDVRNVQVEKAPNSVVWLAGTPFVAAPSEYVSNGIADGPNLVSINDTWGVSQASSAVVSGELVQTVTGVGGNTLSQVVSVTSGRTYQVSATVRFASGNTRKAARLWVDSTADLTLETAATGEDETTTISGTWVADAASCTLKLEVYSTAGGYGAYLDVAFWSDLVFAEITPEVHGCNVDGVEYFDRDNPHYIDDSDVVLRGVFREANHVSNLVQYPFPPDGTETQGWALFGAAGGGSVTLAGLGAKERGIYVTSMSYISGVATGYGPLTRELVSGQTYYVTIYQWSLTGGASQYAIMAHNVNDDDQTFYSGLPEGLAVVGTEDAGAITSIVEEEVYDRSLGLTLWKITFALVPDSTSTYRIGSADASGVSGGAWPHAVFVSEQSDVTHMESSAQGRRIPSQWEPRMASGQQLVEHPTDATQWASWSGATQTDQNNTVYSGLFKRVAIKSAGGTPDGYVSMTSATLALSVDDIVCAEVYVQAGTSAEVRVNCIDLTNGNASAGVDYDPLTGELMNEWSDANSATILHHSFVDLGWAIQLRITFKKRDLATSDFRVLVGPNSAVSGEYVIALGCFVTLDDYKTLLGGKQQVSPYVDEQLADNPLDASTWTAFSGATVTDNGTTVENSGLTFKNVSIKSAGGTDDFMAAATGLSLSTDDVLCVEAYLLAGTSGQWRLHTYDATLGGGGGIYNTTFNVEDAINENTGSGNVLYKQIIDLGWCYRVRLKFQYTSAVTGAIAGVGPQTTTSGDGVICLGCFVTFGDFGDFVGGVRVNPLQEYPYWEACNLGGWSTASATRTSTGRSVFGWPEYRIASAGVDWHRIETTVQLQVYDQQTMCCEAWVRAGTSGKIRYTLRDVTTTLTAGVQGTFGSLAAYSNTIGRVSDIREDTIILDEVALIRVRFKVTFNADYGAVEATIGPYDATSGNDVHVYAAVAYKSGVYLDWFRPTVPGYLREPASTNLFENSDMSDWTLEDSVRTLNYALAPDGTKTATRVVDDSDAGTGDALLVLTGVVVTTTKSNIIGAMMKADQDDWGFIETAGFDANGITYFDLVNGVVGTSTHTRAGMLKFADGWWWCWIEFSSTTDVTGQLRIGIAEADADKSFLRDGSHSILLWNAQHEEDIAPQPTTPIPTSGGTATRNQDELIYKWPSNLLEYTVALECVPLVDSNVADVDVRVWETMDSRGTNYHQGVYGTNYDISAKAGDGLSFELQQSDFQHGRPKPMACSARLDPAGTTEAQGRIAADFGNGFYTELVAGSTLVGHSNNNLLNIGFKDSDGAGFPACYSGVRVLKGDIDDHQLHELARAS